MRTPAEPTGNGWTTIAADTVVIFSHLHRICCRGVGAPRRAGYVVEARRIPQGRDKNRWIHLARGARQCSMLPFSPVCTGYVVEVWTPSLWAGDVVEAHRGPLGRDKSRWIHLALGAVQMSRKATFSACTGYVVEVRAPNALTGDFVEVDAPPCGRKIRWLIHLALSASGACAGGGHTGDLEGVFDHFHAHYTAPTCDSVEAVTRDGMRPTLIPSPDMMQWPCSVRKAPYPLRVMQCWQPVNEEKLEGARSLPTPSCCSGLAQTGRTQTHSEDMNKGDSRVECNEHGPPGRIQLTGNFVEVGLDSSLRWRKAAQARAVLEAVLARFHLALSADAFIPPFVPTGDFVEVGTLSRALCVRDGCALCGGGRRLRQPAVLELPDPEVPMDEYAQEPEVNWTNTEQCRLHAINITALRPRMDVIAQRLEASDLLVLTETKIAKEDVNDVKHALRARGWNSVLATIPHRRACGGVAVLAKYPAVVTECAHEDYGELSAWKGEGRALLTQVSLPNIQIVYVLGVYGYANGAPEDNPRLLRAVADWATSWVRGDYIIAGDLNCAVTVSYDLLSARDAGYVTDILHAREGYDGPRPATTTAGTSIDYILTSETWTQKLRVVEVGEEG